MLAVWALYVQILCQKIGAFSVRLTLVCSNKRNGAKVLCKGIEIFVTGKIRKALDVCCPPPVHQQFIFGEHDLKGTAGYKINSLSSACSFICLFDFTEDKNAKQSALSFTTHGPPAQALDYNIALPSKSSTCLSPDSVAPACPFTCPFFSLMVGASPLSCVLTLDPLI